jgi:DNA-binding FadR family transcriptional regulator
MSEWRIERRPPAVQVRDMLTKMLIDKHFVPGDRLPSESALADRFGVSRSALREALKLMEEERVILCQHGVGRFLAAQFAGIYSEDITHLKSVSELSISLGTTLTCNQGRRWWRSNASGTAKAARLFIRWIIFHALLPKAR